MITKSKYCKPKIKISKETRLFRRDDDRANKMLLAYCFVCFGGCSAW